MIYCTELKLSTNIVLNHGIPKITSISELAAYRNLKKIATPIHPSPLYDVLFITRHFMFQFLTTHIRTGKKWRLGEIPAPDLYHHLVEDFLTDWTNRHDHILLLRRFIEGALNTDLRSFFAESCFEVCTWDALIVIIIQA